MVGPSPTHRLDAASARLAVLGQHERIRDLLKRTQNVAESALERMPLPPDAVASAVGDLRSILEVHMAFEEKVLVPLLAVKLASLAA